MPGDIDDVVGAAHDEDVAVIVLEAGVGGFVIARKLREVALGKTLIGLPQGRQAQPGGSGSLTTMEPILLAATS